jgi:hypothetical protein
MFVLAMYLIAGALHGVCDLDVTNSSSKIVSLADKSTSHSDKGTSADHHCHGCFSVSVPAPPTVVAAFMIPAGKVMQEPRIARPGKTPGIDPPPPKFLT